VVDRGPLSAYKFELIPYLENWKNHSKIWEELFFRCLEQKSFVSPFYHPLFLHSALNLPGSEQPTHLIIGMDGDTPIFGLPVKIKFPFLGRLTLEIWRENSFDHISPLDLTNNNRASKAFFDYGLNNLNVDLFVGEHVTPDFAEAGSQQKHSWSKRAFRCPYLLLPENKQELLSHMSRSFRRKIRRDLRKAESEKIHFRIRTADDGESALINAFETLEFIHNQRSDSVKRNSSFSKNTPTQYYSRIFHQAQRWPNIVHFFELVESEQVIASLFGYIISDRFLGFQSGFLTDNEDLSPGSVLMFNSMSYLIEHGVHEFDFLRGADKYKFHWTSTWREIMILAIGKGIFGGVLVNKFRIKRAMHRYGRLTGIRRWIRNED